MPFVFQPGHRITADRLNYGIQFGTEIIVFSSGSSSVTPTPYDAAVNKKSVTITFDEPFDSTPVVVATAESASPDVMLNLTVSSISTTGFTVTGIRSNTVDTTVQWMAMA